MGRSKRVRKRKQCQEYSTHDADETIIGMKKHMKKTGWCPLIDLRLREFKNTGRGVFSKNKVYENTALIEIPYHLLVTYTTVMKSEVKDIFQETALDSLKMQDYLSVFLALERHKGDSSSWKWYLDSLPVEVPLLPWLCTGKEIDVVPPDLKSAIEKRRWSFEESWERVARSINASWLCLCCKKTPDCVFTMNSYCWGYAMVNTRAVYVDPAVLRRLSLISDISVSLSDEPSMALCPYLDMFNHSDTARTSACLEAAGNGYNFKLSTQVGYEKYKQIFISYGEHDNVKLLCEYGFFIPGNSYDTIEFSLEELLSSTKLKISDVQYKFIRKHRFSENINISNLGLSFSLKAILYVILHGILPNQWSSCIFNDNYDNETISKMFSIADKMLLHKMQEFQLNLDRIQKSVSQVSAYFNQVMSFLKYRCVYIESLRNDVLKKINDFKTCLLFLFTFLRLVF